MVEEKYILRYLPLFYEDLDSKITYISEKLMKPERLWRYVGSYIMDKIATVLYKWIERHEHSQKLSKRTG